MAISYICNRDKAKKNVTVHIDNIERIKENTDEYIKNMKNMNKQCCELNKRISEIEKSNIKASSLFLDLNIKREKVIDLKDLL